jgi:hypothetical protein
VKTKRISTKGRKAMARAGTENLRRYREGIVSEITERTREKSERFEHALRSQFPDAPPLIEMLIESAVASYASLTLLNSKQLLASARYDRIDRITEVQRTVFRTAQALAAYSETSDAQERRLAAIRRPETCATPEVASSPEEAELTEAKRRKDAAWHKFMTEGFSGAPPSERIEDYKDGD